jgi:dTDP-4-amino-4,6-dideoxygalactose transaminase
MSNAHDVTKAFEEALCNYTGAPLAVATTSCTMAITLALAWFKVVEKARVISMPKLSYVGVPAAILNAGHQVTFHDEDWQGEYRFRGTRIYDSARRFTSGMYRPGHMQCVSFHATKILADTQGGAILLDDPDAAAWLRRARFDGRTEGVSPKDDTLIFPSWHAYISCDVAARLLWKLQGLPRNNVDLPRSDYGDLSLQECFK